MDGGHAGNAGVFTSEAAMDGGHAGNAGVFTSEAAMDVGNAGVYALWVHLPVTI